MRQQRRNNARGQLQFPSRRIGLDFFIEIASISGATVTFNLPAAVDRFTLNGNLGIVSSNGGITVVNSAFIGSQLQLTFGAPLNYPTRLVSPQLDPALRSNDGGFYIAINELLNSGQWPPIYAPVIGWSIFDASTNNVIFVPDGLASGSDYQPSSGFQASGGSTGVITGLSGTGVVAAFGSTLPSGETIMISGQAGCLWANSGFLWDTRIVVTVP